MVECNRWLTGHSKENGRVITSREATNAGLARRCLSDMVRTGNLVKVGRGAYMKPDEVEDEMFLLQLRFGKGVYSHETALYLHGLTDLTPLRYSMTFPFGYNTKKANDSGVISRSAVKTKYTLGQTILESPGGNKIRVFDAERTLCDIVRSRKRTDPRVIGEAFRGYLKWKQSDLDKLLRYASALKVESRIRIYLEVLG